MVSYGLDHLGGPYCNAVYVPDDEPAIFLLLMYFINKTKPFDNIKSGTLMAILSTSMALPHFLAQNVHSFLKCIRSLHVTAMAISSEKESSLPSDS